MNGLLNAASVGWATAVLTLLALCATLIATVLVVLYMLATYGVFGLIAIGFWIGHRVTHR